MTITISQSDLSPPDLGLDPTPDIVSDVVNEELLINEALPGLVANEPTALLMDVNNLYKCAWSHGFRLDYKRIRSAIASRCDLRYTAAFSAVDPNDDENVKWRAFMRKQGYVLHTKDIISYTNRKGRDVRKDLMQVEMTMDAMDLNHAFSHVIIGSCDGAFEPLVQRLRKDKFRKVSVLGVKPLTGWGGMSADLANSGEHFYNLMDLLPFVAYGGRVHDK